MAATVEPYHPDDAERLKPFYCQQWYRRPTEEASRLRLELINYYHHDREYTYRRDMRYIWLSEYMYTLKYTTVHPRVVTALLLKRFCNKLTILYYSPSAQGRGRVECDTLVFACILKKWNTCHNGRPHIDFGHFLANPVRLTSTGPTTRPAILSAHQALNEQTASFLDRIRNGAAGDANDFLDPANDKLLPICRAIILIFDQRPNYNRDDSDDYLYLDEAIDGMNVIMVLTGEDTALSEPITFESVKARALPLARPDASGCVDAIRVPIAVAVQFMADLLRKEAAFDPELIPNSIDRDLNPGDYVGVVRAPNAEEWVDGALQAADERGIDNVSSVWQIVQDIRASDRGEPCSLLWHDWFNSSWKGSRNE
ncbi:hypothetical protein JMJ35_010571 [Cladonia borealis]|uniref:Uncharacterized protein n=1 Tax=Cladonia borealis TaxID=184061 RepID=A0AA39QSW4_9LECA|nr:hypothetical protein JMJ35_010571 [Cladonia borealis]